MTVCEKSPAAFGCRRHRAHVVEGALAARAEITQGEERGVALQQMRNAQRPAQHSAPAVIIEVRLRHGLAAQRELLGIGVGALPLERDDCRECPGVRDSLRLPMNPPLPPGLRRWPPGPPNPPPRPPPNPPPRPPPNPPPPGPPPPPGLHPDPPGAWNAARLAFDARARKTAGRLEYPKPARAIRNHPGRFANRCSAIRSPGTLRWRLADARRGIVLRGGCRDLVQFVFRGSAAARKPPCCCLGALPELSGLSAAAAASSSDHSVGCDPGTNLDLLASGLESEHLDFHRVSSRREIGNS